MSLWTEVRGILEAASVETPVLDARILVEVGACVSRLDIVTDPRRPVEDDRVEAVLALARRRAAREPLAYILGRKPFWTHEFEVNPSVLIPRPETELVVEAALAAIPTEAPCRIVDLGVGSGAILLSALSERPKATGLGVDASESALELARRNAAAMGLASRAELRQANWWDGVEEKFDVVVANPPYIPAAEVARLAPEVTAYEPHLALAGGVDGLEAYREIVAGLDGHLLPGGVFAFEVGVYQADSVRKLLSEAGFELREPLVDLGGVARVVTGWKG